METLTVTETIEPPEKLIDLERWLCWRIEERNGKQTKPPLKPQSDPFDHEYAKTNDPETWADYATAKSHAEKNDDVEGVGFVFSPGDVLLGVDLDDVRDPDTGETVDWAVEVIETLDSYTEVSPSGTGYHIYTVGIKPDTDAKETGLPDAFGNDEGELEIYDEGRFFTFTGEHVEGTPQTVEKRASAVRDVYHEYMEDDEEEDDNGDVNTPDVDGDLDDDELLDIIRNSGQADKFERLFDRGDTSMHGGDHSVADLSLCQILAFWTGGDRQWMDSLFRQSSLMRDKWDEVHSANGDTYGEMTIGEALSEQEEYFDPSDYDGDPQKVPPQARGGDDSDDDGDDDDDNDDSRSIPPSRSWDRVVNDYWDAENDAITQKEARHSAVQRLRNVAAFATDRATDVLYAYDPDTGIFESYGEAVVREKLANNLEHFYTAHEKNEVVSRLKGLTTHEQSEFGGPDGHINVANGVLDLESEELKDHSPEYLYTAGSPVEYDPNAESPKWREFLKDVTTSKRDRMLLQEFAGYTLMHWDYPHHKALFLVGPGASGKSTFLDTIRALLGDEAVASVTPHELGEERFAGVELHGAWANIRNDIPSETIHNTGKFKEIVGGDPIKVEEKYQDTFTISPRAKHMYSTNQLPDAAVDDDAFYRRILLVSFPTTVPRDERDPHLQAKLEKEYSGILNWAIEGLKRLQKQGKFTGDESPEQTRQTWEAWGSSIKKFKNDCMEVEADNHVSKQDAYAAYVDWCQENGLPAESQRKMTRKLKEDPEITDGRRRIDGRQARVFVGADIIENRVPQEPDDDDETDAGRLGDY
jgi:putative DNA primase/helicase